MSFHTDLPYYLSGVVIALVISNLKIGANLDNLNTRLSDLEKLCNTRQKNWETWSDNLIDRLRRIK